MPWTAQRARRTGPGRRTNIQPVKHMRVIRNTVSTLGTLALLAPRAFAQAAGGTGIEAPGASANKLSGALSSALAIIVLISFFMGVVAIINGGMSIWKGDTSQGKMSLIAGVVIAGASVVTGALFNAFGYAQALTPTFNW